MAKYDSKIHRAKYFESVLVNMNHGQKLFQILQIKVLKKLNIQYRCKYLNIRI